MKDSVAVIGGGIFGSVAAIQLARAGYQTELFEARHRLLDGETIKSVLRLHLGLHYPRDPKTALQSIEGYRDFLSHFPDCVDFDFVNYYGLAAKHSRVDVHDFLDFARYVSSPFRQVPIRDIGITGLEMSLVSHVFESPEGVICPDRLRCELERQLEARGVEVSTNAQISEVSRSGPDWEVIDENTGSRGKFRLVVLATYGLDNLMISNSIGGRYLEREFHNTLVIEATIPELSKIGLTVIDGDFLTLLPKAFSNRHLIYAPGPSVLTRETGFVPSEHTNKEVHQTILRSAETSIIERFRTYFPELALLQDPQPISGKRAIEAGVAASDRRQTAVNELDTGLIEIVSGKIDHCLLAADLVLRYLD